MAAVPKIPLSERLQFAGAGEPIAEYNDENNGCVLSEIIYRASLLEPQKLEVFHAILIEPFAALEERSGP